MKVITEKHRKEYDAFGPWIREIQNNDEVPDLFLKDFAHDSSVELAIKVPRHIERRETEPGVNLYDYLVALYPDSLLILKRVDTFVERREVARCDVIGVSHLHELLRGELLIHLCDETICLPFNSVSEKIIENMVRKLRPPSHAASQRESPERGEPFGEMSILFKNLLHNDRLEEPLAFLAHQRINRVTLRLIHWYDRILACLPRRVQESLYLDAGRDLMIIQQIPQIVYYNSCCYGYMKTYIPLRSITAIGSTPHPRFEGVETLSIHAGNREFTAQVEQGFLEAAGPEFDRVVSQSSSI